MLSGIYSLISAAFFMVMDAVDVAFTEAAVGAGISTLLILSTLAATTRFQRASEHKSILIILLVTITTVLLLYGTVDMPIVGSASAPIHQFVAPHYINDSMAEIGIPNIVTSVLASYRSYDTLGEVTVIFTAGIGVLTLLLQFNQSSQQIDENTPAPMQQHLVLRIISKSIIPLILLFALYVQFHGDYGPGGGFQAGIIFASGFILYSMIFGLSAAHQVISPIVLRILSSLGLLLYGSIGLVSLLNDGSFLNYSVLLNNSIQGQHLGILLIELGVGITVSSVMIMIFFTFTGRLLTTGTSTNEL
ncbi:Na(+) H(+) antiporter subunit B [hydrothermal vent metagenome]|uniref:Na(+) H(+) antiporter subunit B n=1 Tax=hydrothermal vent metagenome TaxID=652676 RepID=A0A3B1A4I6_9ZZZZ